MRRFKIILIVGGVLCVLVSNIAVMQLNKKIDEQEVEISDLKAEKHISDSLHLYKDERLGNYLNVTLIQDSIIGENTFTKRLKENHKPLLEHSSKL